MCGCSGTAQVDLGYLEYDPFSNLTIYVSEAQVHGDDIPEGPDKFANTSDIASNVGQLHGLASFPAKV